ncbi:MAG: TetR/AcrR family transcriptional regulator [Alphaproteobacteria bacterium]
MAKRKATTRTDGQETRRRIIEAAAQHYAQTGFAETTNKIIAATADVDLASINYHFGSRSGLYQAVLVEAHRQLVSLEKLAEIQAQTKTAEEKLYAFIKMACTTPTTEKNYYAQILAREVAAQTTYFDILFDKEIIPKMNIIRSIISEITQIPADSPEILPCLINIFAPCLMYMLRKSNKVSLILNIPQEDFIEQHYRFTIAGLKAIAQYSL